MTKLWKNLIAMMLFILGITGCSQHFNPPEVERIVSVADDPKGLEKWVLQESFNIRSKETMVLSLVSANKEVNAYSPNKTSIHSKLAKNILFIRKNNSPFWLFKNNKQLIMEFSTFLTRQGNYYPVYLNNENRAMPKAIFYKIISRDSNGDNKINKEDSLDLAVSNMQGQNYKVLVKSISDFISAKEIDDTLILVYQKEGIGYSMQISLDKFNVLSNNMLPKVGE